MGLPWAPPTPARQLALSYRDGWGSLRNESSPRDARALSRPPQKACAEVVRVVTPGQLAMSAWRSPNCPPTAPGARRGVRVGLVVCGHLGAGARDQCSAGPEQPSSHLLEGVGGTG